MSGQHPHPLTSPEAAAHLAELAESIDAGMAEARGDWATRRAARQAEDGFLVDLWGDDGEVLAAFGHVDVERFRAQSRWLLTELYGLDEAELDEWGELTPEHRYVIPDVDENGEAYYRWSVLDERVPQVLGRAQVRPVGHTDPRAVAVTMVDAS